MLLEVEKTQHQIFENMTGLDSRPQSVTLPLRFITYVSEK